MSLIRGNNYRIVASNGETRYITSNYVLYEKMMEDGLYSHGYIKIPAENNLSLEKGCYAFEINEGAVSITDTETFLTTLNQSSIAFSAPILESFTEKDDGVIETTTGYDLYNVSNYFSETIVEEGSYVKHATLDIVYQDDKPTIKIICDIYNDNTQTSNTLTLTFDSFNETSVNILDTYLESIK